MQKIEPEKYLNQTCIAQELRLMAMQKKLGFVQNACVNSKMQLLILKRQKSLKPPQPLQFNNNN